MLDDFNLRYLTSGDTNISLKRKVFCAYHPDDFLEVNEVFQDISKVCEATLFYYESGKEPTEQEQLEEDLKSMNLFILIVTSNFLFKPCFANKVVYEFAVKHAIPVLPILFEGGLEEVFNEKIGNLQCLSKVLERFDATTVPYQEKLSNYLSQVLSADIDMKRCYKAFDTSIFLSYRKKDRKYAQRLMELIHEDEDCRNIAIWYDEFLVPGEDFNDGIKAELEESSMFVLVVTPHIVEGDNYITLTEYPMATSLNKTVISFEMQPTDYKKLKVFCPGIEKTIGTANGRKVRKAIQRALKKLGIVQNKKTDERTFLIGLAYLKGICVEKNSEVGFAMISKAAKSDMEEAIKTLVLLYRNGEGTSQDLDEASILQNRLLEKYQEEYKNVPSDQNAHVVLKAYLDLAEIQTQNEAYKDAQNTYYRMQEFSQNPAIKDNLFAKRYSAMAYELAGKLWMKMGVYEEAKHISFKKAANLREKIYELEPTIQTQLEMIEVQELLAECYEQLNQTLGVKDRVAYIKRLMVEVKDIETKVENYYLLKRFMLCNNKLGHLYTTINMWDTSAKYIEKAISLAESLLEISSTKDVKKQLLIAYMNAGDCYLKCDGQERCEDALKAYRKAREIATGLLEEKETLETQLDMAAIEERMGHVISKNESDERAVQYYENALIYSRRAHKLADTIPVKRKLSQCCVSAAMGYQNIGDIDKAFILLKESEKLIAEAMNESSALVLRTELAETLVELGNINKAQLEFDEALECFRRAHEFLKEAWLRTGVLRELLLYMDSFKSYIAAAKRAGEFDLVNELKMELKCLYEEHDVILKEVLFNSYRVD